MEGELEHVPVKNMDEDELESVGKIITHAYVQYGLFPLGLSKVSMKHAVSTPQSTTKDLCLHSINS